MKQKILAALKNKYANLGFGQKALDGVADYLEKTVTEESQIETAISGVEPLLKVFQSEADRSRTELNALKSENEELKKKVTQTDPKDDPKDDPKPPFDAEAFKAEILKSLRDEQDAYSRHLQKVEQRKADITAKAKEFGIPERIAARMTIDENTDLEEYFKGVKQEFSDAGFEFSELPDVGGGGVKTDGESIANLINQGTKEIVEQSKK